MNEPVVDVGEIRTDKFARQILYGFSIYSDKVLQVNRRYFDIYFENKYQRNNRPSLFEVFLSLNSLLVVQMCVTWITRKACTIFTTQH